MRAQKKMDNHVASTRTLLCARGREADRGQPGALEDRAYPTLRVGA
jgi:hypothetical protein